MFKRHALATALLAVALPVLAAAPELDEAVMENIEIVNESLGSNLGLKDAAAVTIDARDLEKLFGEVEVYFVARGDAADGVTYVQKSREATAGIISAVGAGQFEAAANLAAEISRTCKACHRKYKPD
jgi:hypothetical protein